MITIGTFITMTVALACSGALIIVSAITGYIRSKNVEKFTQELENGQINLDEELRKEQPAGGEANA